MEEKNLKLPSEFVKKHGSELSDVVELKISADGSSWKVELRSAENDIWINGLCWHRFMQWHVVSIGHFLVLKYKGMSNFMIFIFSTTTVGREVPYPKFETSSNENNLQDGVNNEESGKNHPYEDISISNKRRRWLPTDGVLAVIEELQKRADIILTNKLNGALKNLSEGTTRAMEKVAKFKPENFW